jgi:hypothetical protein
MMQAAAAAAADGDEGADDGAASDSAVVWRVDDDNRLWLAQLDVAHVDALAVEFERAHINPGDLMASKPSADLKSSAQGAGGAGAGTEATTTASATVSSSGSKYKWTTALDHAFVFDFATATPKTDVSQMCWGRDVVGVMRSDAGAEGVFFVQTTTGAVVLKGSRSIGPEVFSSLLGSALGV